MTKVFHPHTAKSLENLVQELPQSLLLHGPYGIGLMAAAEHLATKLNTPLISVLPEKDERVDLEKGVISVASIRRLYDLTKTIETGKRLIVIDYAERMGPQAQNAFLKLLEEPGANTHFVLLTHEPSALLPTVLSRLHRMDMRHITAAQSESLLDSLGVKDAKKRAQLLFIASGLPAELTHLAQDDAYFEARGQIVRDAREYLQGSSYDRLVLSQKYKDDARKAKILLQDALKLVQQNVVAGKSDLIPTIETLLAAHDRIAANGNVRLQLAAAMV